MSEILQPKILQPKILQPKILQPIGFVQEDFHSEVLDFLFELCSFIYPDRQLLLYNNSDRYNNKDLFLKKYKNLIVKEFNHFIPDLVSAELEKTFIISYDNIFHLKLFENYKEKLIFIAHSENHTSSFKMLNINYFSLTPLLSNNYMLPVINKTNNIKLLMKDSKIDHFLLQLKDISTKNNLKIIMTIGYFLENNKDIKLIEKLLGREKFIIIAFVPEISDYLNDLIKKYPNFIFAALRLKTEAIRHAINYLNINHLLFCPPENSDYFKNSWSGALAFGLDNNLHLIVPDKIVEIYNLKNNHILSYKNENEINLEQSIYTESLQSWKDNVFSRNKKTISNFIQLSHDTSIHIDKKTLSINLL